MVSYLNQFVDIFHVTLLSHFEWCSIDEGTYNSYVVVVDIVQCT